MNQTEPPSTRPTTFPNFRRKLYTRSPSVDADRTSEVPDHLTVKLDVVLELLEELTAELRSVPLEDVRRRSAEIARARRLVPRSSPAQFELFEESSPEDAEASSETRDRPSATAGDEGGRRGRASRRTSTSGKSDAPLYKLILPV